MYRRLRSARIRREYLHDFSRALAFSFSSVLTFRFPLLLNLPLELDVSVSYAYHLSSLQTRILLCTVSRQTSLTDFTPVDFHDLLRRIRPPLLCLPSLQHAHRASLQLPLSSANRFKSSGSHRHAHKTRRRKEEERMSEEEEGRRVS